MFTGGYRRGGGMPVLFLCRFPSLFSVHSILSVGLGASPSGTDSIWGVVAGRKASSHQRPGDASSCSSVGRLSPQLAGQSVVLISSVANHREFSLDLWNQRSQWGNGKRPLNLGNLGDFQGILGLCKIYFSNCTV